MAELESIEQAKIHLQFRNLTWWYFLPKKRMIFLLKNVMGRAGIRDEIIGHIPVEYLPADKGSGDAVLKALEAVEDKYGTALLNFMAGPPGRRNSGLNGPSKMVFVPARQCLNLIMGRSGPL